MLWATPSFSPVLTEAHLLTPYGVDRISLLGSLNTLDEQFLDVFCP